MTELRWAKHPGSEDPDLHAWEDAGITNASDALFGMSLALCGKVATTGRLSHFEWVAGAPMCEACIDVKMVRARAAAPPADKPKREANLRPGAAPGLRVGDRWSIRLRGAWHLIGCRILEKRARGMWRIVLDGGLGRIEVPPWVFIDRLPPAKIDPIASGVSAELSRLRAEIGRLAEIVSRIEPDEGT